MKKHPRGLPLIPSFRKGLLGGFNISAEEVENILMPIAAVYGGDVLPVSLLCSATIITGSLLPSSVL